MELYVYIDRVAKRVEMFQDEKVSVTSTIQNYSDIGKLFTDYSQSFTIPASPINNAIFSHWYDNAVDNGFDARVRYFAYIEIDTIPFKFGNVQLEKANKKNGYIESYTLTFYGNLTQLKDKFGDDKLNSLNYSSLNHTYDASTIISKISTSPGAVGYPLIGNTRRYEYLTTTTSDVTTNTGAINWDDLFPTVRVKEIFDFIENKYDITFTGNFLNYGQFKKLHMLMKNMELPRGYNQGVFFDQHRFTEYTPFSEYNTTTNVITSDWNGDFKTNPSSPYNVGGRKRIIIKFVTIPNTGFTSTNYRVDLYQDDVIIKTFDNLTDQTVLTLLDVRQSDDADSHKYKIKVSSIGAFDFKAGVSYIRSNIYGDRTSTALNYGTGGTPTPSGQSYSAIQDIVNYVPDIKVSDFFMGIVRMFNLIITPIDDSTFKLEPLELYYQSGQIKDLTPYIYSEELDIEKPKLFKSIEFTYEKSENVLNNAFRSMFNREYGDLIYDSGSNSESGKYEIKLPFEDVMWEKTTGENFMTATLWNKDLQTYTPKPILMYENGLEDVSVNPIKIYNGSTYTSINNYIRFNNDIPIGGTDLSYVHTLNWGEEISSWYLEVAPNGLYKRHYEQYIANLYNQKTRIIKAKAKLEPLNLTNLKLNDRIIIRDNRYIINSYTADLTNGETSFELINDYRTLGYSSVGYKYASVELLKVDNTEQEVQIDFYLGMFQQYEILATTVGGFLDTSVTGIQYEDVSTILTIDANTSGLERTDTLGVTFLDYNGNDTTVYIYITQDA